MMRVLIWNLRSQRHELETKFRENVELSFFLVPTEPGNLPMLSEIANDHEERRIGDMTIVSLSDEWFVNAKEKQRTSVQECTPQWREQYLQWATEDAIR